MSLVPLWAGIAGGAVAGVLALAGVLTSHFLEMRRNARNRRDAAYANLAAAMAVFLVRVEVFRSDRSWRQSAGESMMASTTPVVMSLISMIPERLRPRDYSPLQLAQSIRSPEMRLRVDQSYQAMLNALEALVLARTEVELVGSQDVRTAASEIIEASLEFADAARKPVWPWNYLQANRGVEEKRKAMLESRNRYIALIAAVGNTSAGQTH